MVSKKNKTTKKRPVKKAPGPKKVSRVGKDNVSVPVEQVKNTTKDLGALQARLNDILKGNKVESDKNWFENTTAESFADASQAFTENVHVTDVSKADKSPKGDTTPEEKKYDVLKDLSDRFAKLGIKSYSAGGVKDPDGQSKALVDRLIMRGIKIDPEEQLNELEKWVPSEITVLDNFLKSVPVGHFPQEILKEAINKFGVTLDPPTSRFLHSKFGRAQILIRQKEAAELDKINTNHKHDMADTKPASDWFEKFRNTEVHEAQAKDTAEKLEEQYAETAKVVTSVEKLEEQYAEKVKAFLKAKRELNAAKLELEKEYGSGLNLEEMPMPML